MTPNVELPIYDERRGAFAALRGRRVLIYWPHGLGDFVHFSCIPPLLEPSNAYSITRFGDDYVHLYDANEVVAPLYSGERRIGDGSELGARHLGIDFKHIRNRVERLTVPEPLRTRIGDERIDAVLYTDYPECEGRTPFPFHTKARALAKALVSRERLAQFDLSLPLQSTLTFTAPPETRRRIEERLRSLIDTAPFYLVSPGGHTLPAKTWPADEVERVPDLLRAVDASAQTIVLDEHSIAERFGDLDLPFAHVLVTLLRACSGFIGVPSGPLHAAIAANDVPSVGIWLSRHPDWYDEPSPAAVHLLGPHPIAQRLDRRPGSTTKPSSLAHCIVPFADRVPTASDAVEALLSL
jgi:hypothetical protein